MNLPASFLPARCCPASLRGSARALALVLALHGAAFAELPPWTGLAFVGVSAHADDGDGGDGDGGGDGGGGGGAGGGDGGGGGGEAAADYEPLEDPLPIAGETFIADELLLLAPSQAALNRATALGLRVIERVQTRQLGVSFARLRLPRAWTRVARARSCPSVVRANSICTTCTRSPRPHLPRAAKGRAVPRAR